MSTSADFHGLGFSARAFLPGREFFWAVLAPWIGFGLALVMLAGTTDTRVQPGLLEWQVSSFSGLSTPEQAVHSALVVAAEDIGWLNYDSGDWPEPDVLNEYLIPPFVRDAFWRETGSLKWRRLAAADVTLGGTTAYLGDSAQLENQSTFLLVFQHRHLGAAYSNEAEIWITPNTAPQTPTAFRAQALVSQGWKRVVAYNGDDEAERIHQ